MPAAVDGVKICNNSKGKKGIDEWYSEQEFFDKSRLDKVKEHCGDRLLMEVS